jgi:hypothetical protein
MTYISDCNLFPLQPSIKIGEMVACGRVAGASIVHKMGYNASITGTTEEDMWTQGGDFAFPLVATYPGAKMGIDSTSAEDKGTATAGTGVRSVKISYLTDAGVEKSETVILNGTDAVQTVATDIWRINSFRAVTVGSTNAAVGTITLQEIDGAPVFSSIAPLQTRARNMAYTVPAGKALLIKEIQINSAAASIDKSFLKYRLIGNVNEGVKQATNFNFPLWEATVAGGGYQAILDEPIYVPAGVDLRMRAVGNAASDAASATCEWRGCLVTV